MTTTLNWVGGSGNWDTAGDWNPLGPPTASSIATINGTAAEAIVVESPNTVMTVILDNPNAAIGIGGAAGAKLTVTNTLAIEKGLLALADSGRSTRRTFASPRRRAVDAVQRCALVPWQRHDRCDRREQRNDQG